MRAPLAFMQKVDANEWLFIASKIMDGSYGGLKLLGVSSHNKNIYLASIIGIGAKGILTVG